MQNKENSEFRPASESADTMHRIQQAFQYSKQFAAEVAKSPEMIDRLIASLDDEDFDIRYEAAETLTMMNDQTHGYARIRTALMKALCGKEKESRPEIRWLLVQGVSRYGVKEGILEIVQALLKTACLDTDVAIRCWAISALADTPSRYHPMINRFYDLLDQEESSRIRKTVRDARAAQHRFSPPIVVEPKQDPMSSPSAKPVQWNKKIYYGFDQPHRTAPSLDMGALQQRQQSTDTTSPPLNAAQRVAYIPKDSSEHVDTISEEDGCILTRVWEGDRCFLKFVKVQPEKIENEIAVVHLWFSADPETLETEIKEEIIEGNIEKIGRQRWGWKREITDQSKGWQIMGWSLHIGKRQGERT